jgi:hypothetical protein
LFTQLLDGQIISQPSMIIDYKLAQVYVYVIIGEDTQKHCFIVLPINMAIYLFGCMQAKQTGLQVLLCL